MADGHHWLLRERDEPAENLAETIIKKRGLRVPIPIRRLVEEIANLSEESWPYKDCDALAVDLATSNRPSVFLRADLPKRRKRFTLAHEYGHLNLAWHVGNLACNPTINEFSVEALQPAENRSDFAAKRRIREQEAEATRFASCLLIPETFIRPLVQSGDMGAVLMGLNAADTSCQAALMRLHQILQPGFVFAYSEGPGWEYLISPGTALPSGFNSLSPQDAKLTTESVESGTVELSDRRVIWYRLAEFEDHYLADDPRSTTEVLRAAIAATESQIDKHESLFKTINGIASGKLSQDRADTAEQALAILRQHFSARDDLKFIRTHPDFDLYLRRKAYERIERKKKKQK